VIASSETIVSKMDELFSCYTRHGIHSQRQSKSSEQSETGSTTCETVELSDYLQAELCVM